MQTLSAAQARLLSCTRIRGALKGVMGTADAGRKMNSHVFVPSMLVGGASVAAWAYVRFPRAQPASLVAIVAHVCLSFLILTFAPVVAHAVLVAIPRPLSAVLVVAGVTAPALTYVLLSWVWLIAYILRTGRSGPRGGHPVTATGR